MPKTTRPTGKQQTARTGQTSRRLTGEEYRILAERADESDAEKRKTNRRARLKGAVGVPARQWTSEQQVKVANRQEQAATRGTKTQRAAADRPSGDQFWNTQRAALIRRRNRNRRLPWYAPLASVGFGLAGEGAGAVLAATTAVDPRIAACVSAAAPVVTAVGIAITGEKRYQRQLNRTDPDAQDRPTAPAHRRFWPEVLTGAGGCSALVYWIATAGMSWPVVLVILVGTSLVGTRWWRDNPLGPGVDKLEPPRPAETEPESESEVPSITTLDDGDTYPRRWQRHNASRNGKAPGSRLTNEHRTDYVLAYDVELKPGGQDVSTLRNSLAALASGLKIRQGKLMVLDDEEGRGEHMAQIKIIERDPVADIRYYTGPSVTCTRRDGIVHNIGRYGDGEGELDLAMWNDAGMVPTAIIGVTRSGKSSVGNIAITGMLNTGVMNLCYIDPKGTSSPDLESAARIVILGPENAARAPELINAILAGRRKYASKHRISKFAPSQDLPGWGILHDEFSELVNRSYTQQAKQWTSLVNTIAAMGMWPVAMNQAMQESKWVDDQCRSAFATQFIVMRMRTTSDRLIPGLELPPSSLPNRKGTGVYVYDDADRSNVPIQFDYVPEGDEAYKHPDAPLTTTQAFEQFNLQPELLEVDRMSIESVLGPANEDGRWVVGGAFGTHKFPSKDDTSTGSATTGGSRSGSGWGAQIAQAVAAAADEDPLTQPQRRVYELIAGGTSKRADLVPACPEMSASTLDRALEVLVGDEWIKRAGQGRYAVAQPEPV